MSSDSQSPSDVAVPEVLAVICGGLARTRLSKRSAADWTKILIRRAGFPHTPPEQMVAAMKNAYSGKSFSNRKQVAVQHHNHPEDLVREALRAMGVGIRYNKRWAVVELDIGDGEGYQPITGGLEGTLYWEVRRQVRSGVRLTADGKVELGKPVKIKRADWHLALETLAHANQADPFRDWLDGLPEWDGEERVDGLLAKLYRLEGDEDLARFAVRSVLVGAVRRAYQPGAKHDTVAVLVGGQGIGKSTLWKLLLPDSKLFSDALDFDGDEKSRVESILGHVLVEASEMHGLTRAEFAKVKQFITRQTDKVRLAYARHKESYPRMGIIVGSSNESRVLPNDPSGNRRFIAVPVAVKDGYAAHDAVQEVVEYLEFNREQLWAEAKRMREDGVPSWIDGALAAKQEQVNIQYRSTSQIVQERLAAWLEEQVGRPFTLSAAVEGAGFKDELRGERVVRTELKYLGYTARKHRDELDGKWKRMWSKDETETRGGAIE